MENRSDRRRGRRRKQLLNDLKEERREHYLSHYGEEALGVLQDGLLKDKSNLIENLKKIK